MLRMTPMKPHEPDESQLSGWVWSPASGDARQDAEHSAVCKHCRGVYVFKPLDKPRRFTPQPAGVCPARLEEGLL